MISIDISKKVFNAIYLPYLDNKARYEVYYGGSGSGKSVFIAQKKVYQHLKDKKRNSLFVRQTSNTNRLSTFPLIKQMINQWNVDQLFKINESDMRIRNKVNGNEIVFAGLDDVEKLKSITFANGELTDIWIEEASEISKEDFLQLDLRLRGRGTLLKQITVSFNPVSITHWLKDFIDSQKNDISVLRTTYKDNRFIDDKYKQVLESFKDTDPYYYSVYALGEWGVLGKTIFNAAIVTERINQLRNTKPIKQGVFIYEYEHEKIIDSTIKWLDDDTGPIRVFEEPQRGYPYVVGGDTAGEGSDHFTGQCINNVTGRQVATLRHQFDEDLYAKQMYCLGKHYNNALLGIETNFSTYPVKELSRLDYHNQYNREIPDTYTGKLKKTYGFQTGKITRPVIISNLVQIVRESPELISDIDTLEEMLTFVKNEQGKAEAQNGKFDDLIMGLAIAYHVRTQQSYAVTEGADKPKEKLIDKLGAKPKNRKLR